jgi:hypothetical protein
MKGKQLFLLLVLAAVAGGAWYLLSERNRSSWSETGGGGGKVVEFPINDVSHLRVKNASGEVNLVKKAEVWTVQERADYPANFEQVSSLLRKLWELKTVQEVKVGASQLPRLELEEPGKGDKTGTLVEFLGAEDKALAALLLGKPHLSKAGGAGEFGSEGFPSGRYVKVVGQPKVSLVSDSLDDVQPKPERWLRKEFVKVDGPKSVTVAGQTDAQKWTLTRENSTADWQLSGAKPEEKVDTGKTFALGTIFSTGNFEDVLAPDAKPEDTGLDKPTTATIETFDGFRYELKIGKAMGDNYPVLVTVSANLPKERTPGKDEKEEDKKKLEEEFAAKQKTLTEKLAAEQKFANRVFLVPKQTVEPLLKDRSALLAEKPSEATPPAAAAPVAPSAPVSATTPPLSLPPAAPPAPPAPAPAETPAAPAPPKPPAPSTEPVPPSAPPAGKPAAASPAAAPAPAAPEKP